MKRILFSIIALTAALGVQAQDKFFNFGIGLNAGTNGLGADASIGLSRFIQIRGGVSFIPERDYSYTAKVSNSAAAVINAININSKVIPDIADKVDMTVRPNMLTYHALLDLYPSRFFHFTVGAYFGEENPVRFFSSDGEMKPLAIANHYIGIFNAANPEYAVSPVGLKMGAYTFTPDAEGNIDADIRVKHIRPYFGIGFGRAVPRKSRVGCSLDLGVQYWGKPTIYNNGVELEPRELKGEKFDVLNKVSTLPVYPVATFRIAGRIL